MAKDFRSTSNDEPEVKATETVPPPGTAPHGIPVGLPPESYMTAQEAHVAGGGEYAPPEETEEEAAARRAKTEKEDAARRAKEDEAAARKAKEEDEVAARKMREESRQVREEKK